MGAKCSSGYEGEILLRFEAFFGEKTRTFLLGGGEGQKTSKNHLLFLQIW